MFEIAILIVLIILIIVIVRSRDGKVENLEDWPLPLPQALLPATKPAVMYPGGKIPDEIVAEEAIQQIIAEESAAQTGGIATIGGTGSRKRMGVSSGRSSYPGGGYSSGGYPGGYPGLPFGSYPGFGGVGGLSSGGIGYTGTTGGISIDGLSNLSAQQSAAPISGASLGIQTQDALSTVSAGAPAAAIQLDASMAQASVAPQVSAGPRQRSVDVSEGANVAAFDFRTAQARSASAFEKVKLEAREVVTPTIQPIAALGVDEYYEDDNVFGGIGAATIQRKSPSLPQSGSVSDLIKNIGGPDISALPQGLSTPGLLSSPAMLKAVSQMGLDASDVVNLIQRDKKERGKGGVQTRSGVSGRGGKGQRGGKGHAFGAITEPGTGAVPFDIAAHAASQDSANNLAVQEAINRARLEQSTGIAAAGLATRSASTGAPSGSSNARGSANRAGSSFKDSSSNTIIDLGNQTLTAQQQPQFQVPPGIPGQPGLPPQFPIGLQSTAGVIVGEQKPISSD